MKILLAVDGSAYTKHMLAYLAAHDELIGTLHGSTVAHIGTAIPPRAAAAVGKEVVKKYHDDEAEKVFKPIRAFFKQRQIDATFVHKVGPAGETIARLAEQGKFDLVVMGSRGHAALINLVLGSVATKVMAQCSVPVLLVR